jgi:hypothetical protein
MDMTNNIYGNIRDNQELIISIGNYNNIFSIVSNNNNSIQINNLNNINDNIMSKISRFIIKYETQNDKQFKELLGISKGNAKNKKLKFTLKLQDNDILYTINNTKNKKERYLNIKAINKDTAIAVISEEPRIFWIEYSTIDNSYRSNLLAGSLYLLATNYNNKKYNVQWKINTDLNGELIIFLPTTWYEKIDDYCKLNTGGYIQLIENLKRLSFKGYTTDKWCEEVSHIYNCDIYNKCGDCMGACDNSKICLPNLENNNAKFLCDDYTNEDKLYNYEAITFINDDKSTDTKSSNSKSSDKYINTNNLLNDNLTKITDIIKNNQDIIYNNYVLIIIIFIIIITFIIYYMYK